jgi:hypothetical protein
MKMKSGFFTLLALSVLFSQVGQSTEKVQCPNLAGSYVCGSMCDEKVKTNCISDNQFFGFADGELRRDGIIEGGFKISESFDAEGTPTFKFAGANQQFAAFTDIPWQDSKVKTTCQDKKSFIIQLLSTDQIFTGNQWLSTFRLSSQVFSKNRHDDLIVTKTDSVQSLVAGPALSTTTEKLVCHQAKWQNK